MRGFAGPASARWVSDKRLQAWGLEVQECYGVMSVEVVAISAVLAASYKMNGGVGFKVELKRTQRAYNREQKRSLERGKLGAAAQPKHTAVVSASLRGAYAALCFLCPSIPLHVYFACPGGHARPIRVIRGLM